MLQLTKEKHEYETNVKDLVGFSNSEVEKRQSRANDVDPLERFLSAAIKQELRNLLSDGVHFILIPGQT